MCFPNRPWLNGIVIFGGALLLSGAMGWQANCRAEEETAAPVGRELFLREWIPNDPRSHNGDGLGPMFNDSSCVACHNQGGTGGGGPRAKNAQILSALPMDLGLGGRTGGQLTPEEQQAALQRQREELKRIHPGLGTAGSLVLHRFSTEPEYAAFRGKLMGVERSLDGGFNGPPFGGQGSIGIDKNGVRRELTTILTASQLHDLNRARTEASPSRSFGFGGGMVGNVSILISERNTPALFGSGKIDAIPADVLLAAAEKTFEDFPEINGRVARLRDGRIGRFGWKAQKARLGDFVLTACAVELGLHVPDEPQSGLPFKPDYQPKGMDLDQRQCNALISFVAGLSQPVERKVEGAVEGEYLAGGRQLFTSLGCAACHTPQLGEVTGIYSDLLLHDLGPDLGDTGSYRSFLPNSTEDEELKTLLPLVESSEPVDESKLIGARRQEWRTPPLWGVRDSAPYLHDGRAATLEQAIALHGGEGENTARRYFRLKPAQRLQLTMFLASLTAPQ